MPEQLGARRETLGRETAGPEQRRVGRAPTWPELSGIDGVLQQFSGRKQNVSPPQAPPPPPPGPRGGVDSSERNYFGPLNRKEICPWGSPISRFMTHPGVPLV